MVSGPPRALTVFFSPLIQQTPVMQGKHYDLHLETNSDFPVVWDVASFGSIMVLLVGPNEWEKVFKLLRQLPVALKMRTLIP